MLQTRLLVSLLLPFAIGCVPMAGSDQERAPSEDAERRSTRSKGADDVPGLGSGDDEDGAEQSPDATAPDPPKPPKPKTRTAYSMAFILVAHDQREITAEHKRRLELLRKNLPSQWSKATRGRATMSTTHPVTYLVMPTSELKNNYEDPQLMARRFYASNGDEFDFLSIYTTFQPSMDYSFHLDAQTHIRGIGLPVDKEGQNRFAIYGSKGRLLGVNFMSDNVFAGEAQSFDPIFSSGANLLLHETGHYWCCFVGDEFTGQSTGKLEIRTGPHFYTGLDSRLPQGEPMNSQIFVAQGDGTYNWDPSTRGLFTYNDFTLYFMGLLPEADYDKKFWVLKEDPTTSKWHPYRQVSVRDIIAVEGPREEL